MYTGCIGNIDAVLVMHINSSLNTRVYAIEMVIYI